MDDAQLIERIASNIEKVIIGKSSVIMDTLKGIIAGGHILIEDVPGVGKTTLVKALAASLSLTYSRIQFTPDLLPSDITGISIYNQKTGEFEFKKGPVFANIILADEINRTSPKTQSALLEVMEEHQLSEGNNTFTLKDPFVVLATQNPIEFEGTFRLPEAQLDRFMIKVKLGYAHKESESMILQTYGSHDPLSSLTPAADASTVILIQKKVRNVFVSKHITDYIVDIVSSTRNSKYLSLGASTRAALSLLKIAKAAAFIDGRNYVIPQDIKSNAIQVLSHRVVLSSYARSENLSSENIIADLVDRLPLPSVK